MHFYVVPFPSSLDPRTKPEHKMLSAAPESRGGVLYTTPVDTWHYACWPWACVLLHGHKNPLHEEAPDAVFVLMLLPGAVWNSVVNDATDDSVTGFQHSTALLRELAWPNAPWLSGYYS